MTNRQIYDYTLHLINANNKIGKSLFEYARHLIRLRARYARHITRIQDGESKEAVSIFETTLFIIDSMYPESPIVRVWLYTYAVETFISGDDFYETTRGGFI